MKILLVLFCIGNVLNQEIVTLTSGSQKCHGGILTSRIIQTLCSCIEEEPINVQIGDTISGVREIRKQDGCEKTKDIFVYDSALVVLDKPIDFKTHRPIRIPGLSVKKFDYDFNLTKTCTLVDKDSSANCKKVKTEYCLDPKKLCENDRCRDYLKDFVLCVESSKDFSPTKGSPLICDEITFGFMNQKHEKNRFSVVKIILADRMEHSKSQILKTNLPLVFFAIFFIRNK